VEFGGAEGVSRWGSLIMATARNEKARGPQLEPHQVIIQPLITEKGTHQSTHEHHNAYAFQVNLWATKDQIKHAVQELFNVRVEKVRTQLRLGKKRRFRFRFGRLPNWKKAIVKLHKEDKIEFF
jgi:large subunit ribosomal protein L23